MHSYKNKPESKSVYLGATEYSAPSFVRIEDGLEDMQLCAKLQKKSPEIKRFPLFNSDIIDLLIPALKKCLKSSKRNPTAIDAIFLVSNTLDASCNLNASWLTKINRIFNAQQGINYYHIGIVGCAGFAWAAKVASSLIISGQYRNILIASFDKASTPLQRVYAEDTSFPYVTGDAAAACLLSDSPEHLDYRIINPIITTSDVAQINTPSFERQLPCIVDLFKNIFNATNFKSTDIDLFITNNYSLAVTRLYCQLANIEYKKSFTDTLSDFAHCFSSDSIINLHHATQWGRIQTGDKTLIFSTGMFQWGACIIQKI